MYMLEIYIIYKNIKSTQWIQIRPFFSISDNPHIYMCNIGQYTSFVLTTDVINKS